jgi:hypothetical protein
MVAKTAVRHIKKNCFFIITTIKNSSGIKAFVQIETTVKVQRKSQFDLKESLKQD